MQQGTGPKGGNAIPVAAFGLGMTLIIGVRRKAGKLPPQIMLVPVSTLGGRDCTSDISQATAAYRRPLDGLPCLLRPAG